MEEVTLARCKSSPPSPGPRFFLSLFTPYCPIRQRAFSYAPTAVVGVLRELAVRTVRPRGLANAQSTVTDVQDLLSTLPTLLA